MLAHLYPRELYTSASASKDYESHKQSFFLVWLKRAKLCLVTKDDGYQERSTCQTSELSSC